VPSALSFIRAIREIRGLSLTLPAFLIQIVIESQLSISGREAPAAES